MATPINFFVFTFLSKNQSSLDTMEILALVPGHLMFQVYLLLLGCGSSLKNDSFF